MKAFLSFFPWAVVTLVLFGWGCSKNAGDATKPLEQSFQGETRSQEAIQQVTANLKAGNYQQAVQHLAPVIENRKLTDQQKKAVTATLQQINQAIAANPQLETPEMYKLRQKMFKAVYGQNRF
jgi:hypothetical protein